MCVREREKEREREYICFALIVYLVLFICLFLLELDVITDISLKWQFFSLFIYLLIYLSLLFEYQQPGSFLFYPAELRKSQIPFEGNGNDNNTSHLLIILEIKDLKILRRHDVINLIMKSFFTQ